MPRRPTQSVGSEVPGEDPFLTGTYAAQMVRGGQVGPPTRSRAHAHVRFRSHCHGLAGDGSRACWRPNRAWPCHGIPTQPDPSSLSFREPRTRMRTRTHPHRDARCFAVRKACAGYGRVRKWREQMAENDARPEALRSVAPSLKPPALARARTGLALRGVARHGPVHPSAYLGTRWRSLVAASSRT